MRPGGITARRYAILAEGRFANRHAKTAHGLIAYGRDEIVAVIDSTLADRTRGVLDVLPNLRRDAPIVGTLREALEFSPTSILVGLAPAGASPTSMEVGEYLRVSLSVPTMGASRRRFGSTSRTPRALPASVESMTATTSSRPYAIRPWAVLAWRLANQPSARMA